MIQLFDHQKKGVDFILKKGSGALFWEIGTGKTIGALEIYSRLKTKNPVLKCLVVCPLSLIESAWREENQKFKFDFLNLHDEKLDEKKELFVINYDFTRSPKKVNALASFIKKYPFLCVLDESHKLQNNRTATTKVLLNFRQYFKHRIVMTGTPVTNNELSLWGQMNFAVPSLLHDSFYAFRNTYFHLQRGNQTAGYVNPQMLGDLFKKGWKYQITTAKQKELMERIKPYCHHAKLSDCFDMPEKIFENRFVELSNHHRSIYNEMKNHLVTEIKGKQFAVSVALAKLTKLRELAAGFIFDEAGKAVDIGENPKLKELLDVIEETDGQVIIWANFRHEIKVIKEALEKIAPTVTCYAETPDQQESIEKFKRGEARFIVANPQSLGHGHTLTNCHIQIFYSLNYSFTLYDQCLGRTMRLTQKNNCVYVHILAKNTIDEQILQIVQNKQMSDALLKGFL